LRHRALSIVRASLAAAFLISPVPAAAEWHVKPFAGLTFGGSTTFVDPELAAGTPNLVVGASAVLLGEILGIGVDVGHASGFFERGDQNLLLSSSVTTVSGNIIVALPRRLAEYTLRPYFVGGAGLMVVRTENPPTEAGLDLASNLGAIDVGAGVTGLLTDRLGLNWELRHFRSVSGDSLGGGLTIGGAEQLSFWRASMALVIRY
jgi:hypothetical protein